MKKRVTVSIFLSMAILLTGASSIPEKAGDPGLSITGLVEKPQFLTMRDLSQFTSVSVKLTEVNSDKTYGGFQYRGVPCGPSSNWLQ